MRKGSGDDFRNLLVKAMERFLVMKMREKLHIL
jgi:hypothetical protein